MALKNPVKFPSDLKEWKYKIEATAKDYGLDFFPVIFEILDYQELNEVAAYTGFAQRFPHWTFGMYYDELSKSYRFGLSKIYEMVINNDPCYAYLLKSNKLIDQKTVIAHVYGHCDFFKNNMYFRHTNRKMMDELANHATRIRQYTEEYGADVLEFFLDTCMSIENLIDVHSVLFKKIVEPREYQHNDEFGDLSDQRLRAKRLPSKEYMEDYINPPDFLEERTKEMIERRRDHRCFPENPEADVLLFLINHAPLKNWQRDVLSIIREEAYYFMPQAQTKIMNEGWACVLKDSLVPTSAGFLKMGDIVKNRLKSLIYDGAHGQHIYDWAEFKDKEVINICTKRGFKLGGSVTHQVLSAHDSWRRLDQLVIGEKIKIASAGLWPDEDHLIKLYWEPKYRISLRDVAKQTGVGFWTLLHFMKGATVKWTETKKKDVKEALFVYEEYKQYPNEMCVDDVNLPQFLNEALASFLGYLIGDGHISKKKRVIGLTTGDEQQADHFAHLVTELFGKVPNKKKDGNRWRINFSSQIVQQFLVDCLGLKTGRCARFKEVPNAILRSPKTIVAAFLRAYFDCDGYAGKQGVLLSTSSEKLGEVTQLLLLNFGILSSRRLQKDGCWHVHIAGQSCEVFNEKIGFGLVRKWDKSKKYIEDHKWFKDEDWTDKVVHIDRSRADVFDASVQNTHKYVAQGFINHNSYWHSTMMTLPSLVAPSEIFDFGDHHSGTLGPDQSTTLNPYKLGLLLYKDIENRWNKGRFGKEWEECEDLKERENWDKKLGIGRQKIFEVRKMYNDLLFLDTFLTPEFCRENKLFVFAKKEHDEDSGHPDYWFIKNREFAEIKSVLLDRLTNMGHPIIKVVDGDFRNAGMLLLKHFYEGRQLDIDWMKNTLPSLFRMWKKPVYIQTVIHETTNQQGEEEKFTTKELFYGYDGEDYFEYHPDTDSDYRIIS